jgi:hypothetical protein
VENEENNLSSFNRYQRSTKYKKNNRQIAVKIREISEEAIEYTAIHKVEDRFSIDNSRAIPHYVLPQKTSENAIFSTQITYNIIESMYISSESSFCKKIYENRRV